VEPYFVRSGVFDHLRLAVDLAISDRLTGHLETGMFLRKQQRFVEGIYPDRLGTGGLGDTTFGLTMRLLRDLGRGLDAAVNVGFKIPVGNHRTRREGAILPLDVQPTSGAFGGAIGVFGSKSYPLKRVTLFGVTRVEFGTRNPEGYQSGRLVATAFFLSKNVSPVLDLTIQIRAERRARDRRPSGRVPTSGSQKVFLAPMTILHFGLRNAVSIQADIPVLQYYRREQLATSWGATVTFIRSFARPVAPQFGTGGPKF
jgi:Putative MetA-pathway of phenol degradation